MIVNKINGKSAAIALRVANHKDAAGILEIYTPYVRDTSLSFETEVISLEIMSERILNYLQYWPWLVCEIDGKIAGYAYGSKYRERTGYQWCVECSVYIHDDFQGNHIAKAIYSALFDILRMLGYRNVYAVINLPNDKSVSLHESCGFTWFATYDHVGYKLGQWKNVGWWQLVINDYIHEPAPPLKFPDINATSLNAIFEKAEKGIGK